MSKILPMVYMARHGETEWTVSGRHTGRTDIPLTEHGERNARSLGERLAGLSFERVFSSPLQRAVRTCELAGFGDRVELDPDLMEWDYGAYDGKTSAEIRKIQPGWKLFRDGCPGGEPIETVAARADRVIGKLRVINGNVLVFSHSHFLRFVAARWLGLPPADARFWVLSTAALSIVGYEHTVDEPAIRLWNDDRHAVL